jgi:hypothetical protein
MDGFSLPKQIKILGHIVKIIYPYEFTQRGDLIGQWDGAALEIRINSVDSSGAKKNESTIIPTLIEEIMHGIDLMTGHKIFDSVEGHKALVGISEVLYQILVDNNYVNRDGP